MKQLTFCLIAFALFFASCKKESRTSDTVDTTSGGSSNGQTGGLNEPGYGPSTVFRTCLETA